jgi:hypothetical protein
VKQVKHSTGWQYLQQLERNKGSKYYKRAFQFAVRLGHTCLLAAGYVLAGAAKRIL